MAAIILPAGDPEDLQPVEKIRFAEALIRQEHLVFHDDWMFWGNLADYFNHMACLPEKTHVTRQEWREFNRVQDMATGYIQMAKARGVI